MPNTRELLNNPQFHTQLLENAERLFNLDRLLKEPFVIFDYGVDDFWTTAMNSEKRDMVVKRIRSGNLIPINADAISDIAQNHSALHVYIAESNKNIPTIPTLVSIGDITTWVGKHELPAEIPGVYVKKSCFKDGRLTSHRAEGVSIVRIDDSNLSKHLPKNLYEFLQPFIVPPDEFVRDIRVYSVDGKPVAGLVRRAQKPLLSENLTGQVLPTVEQYPSAKSPGPNEYLDGELKEKVFELSQRIAQVLDEKIRTRKRPFSQFSTFGFGAIDFLLDSNGVPLPVDFDVGPSVSSFENIDQTVAVALAEFLGEMSSVGEIHRKVILIGYKNHSFLDKVMENLEEKLPKEDIIFQETVVTQAFKKLEPKRESQKVGRNESCPCGSGLKYKKCGLIGASQHRV